MASLVLKNVCKTFGNLKVINGVDFEVREGEFIVFVGPSGCGKSTLLRMIAGLEDITSGDLFLDGERMNDVAPDRRGLAMVFQSYALYPHMTVAENMAFALRLAGMSKAERRRKAEDVARVLQLDELLDRKPKQLSGGQRQRVAIGRAIVRNPKVFLFDEPLSNLDAALRVQMRMELVALHRKLAGTMIYVTHDQVEAMTMADRIVVLRAGIVEQIGRPLDLYNRPANLFVAGFIGSPKMNLLPVRLLGQTQDAIDVECAPGRTLRLDYAAAPIDAGSNLTLGLRADMITIEAQGQLEGTVGLVEQLGKETLIHLDLGLGREPLAVSVGGQLDYAIGRSVRLGFDTSRAHLFDAAGNRVGRRGEI